jgi:hypothetical protein
LIGGRRMDSGRIVRFVGSSRVLVVALLISGGTGLLEVLGTGARISIDILELGSFPSW